VVTFLKSKIVGVPAPQNKQTNAHWKLLQL